MGMYCELPATLRLTITFGGRGMPVKRPYVPEVEVDHPLHDDGEGLRVTREQVRDVYFKHQ
ncbi:hypothetical protein GCM10025858_13970 [Alicyclobacillus sacchari]|nr:hypothetical protein GCM10025858_13970 [Alicyclobacillus sacchari]